MTVAVLVLLALVLVLSYRAHRLDVRVRSLERSRAVVEGAVERAGHVLDAHER